MGVSLVLQVFGYEILDKLQFWPDGGNISTLMDQQSH